jgi:hypothetical protein
MGIRCHRKYNNESLLTLTCEKMIVLREWGLMRNMECAIVTAVIISDALNADSTRILLPRENFAFLQRYSGIATSATSAMTSAAGNKT